MFELRKTAPGSRARLGVLHTRRDAIETPVFMPVGTRGTVRTQTPAQLAALGPRLILANTYHLMLRPGVDVFERFCGIHRWMSWGHSVLTDSGGFQVFSLAHERTVGEEGVAFSGAPLLTPERSIALQRAIGADITMVLDECVAATSAFPVARAAVERTQRWAERSRAARGEGDQQLFAIVQGACFEELRRQSARGLIELGGFDGYAIGGLAVGEARTAREDMTELTAGLLPADRPRYLMGVGTPLDILEAVHRGVDMFDCVMPTAWAQHGRAFTSHGRIDIRRGVHKLADQPLDAACECATCRAHSRSYLHHLIKCEEPLGWQLLAHHNLAFYLRLLAEIRGAIAGETFAALYAARRAVLACDDIDNPPQRPRVRASKPTTRGVYAVRDRGIVHVRSGEVMHSSEAPDVEAEAVYVQQPRAIADALAGRRPIVVWDVGLGAAHNAMALVRALDAAPGHADVQLVSFERDLDALQLALTHTGAFAHLRHPAPHVLAQRGRFARDRLTWTLAAGDFLAALAGAPDPDVIFYDPFSAKVDTPLWTLATFRRLRARLAGAIELVTYTSSTALRTSLLAAGFHVARGIASGAKEETTIATTVSVPGHAYLGRGWLERRARSSAPFAADVDPADHAAIERAIAAHPQFAGQ